MMSCIVSGGGNRTHLYVGGEGGGHPQTVLDTVSCALDALHVDIPRKCVQALRHHCSEPPRFSTTVYNSRYRPGSLTIGQEWVRKIIEFVVRLQSGLVHTGVVYKHVDGGFVHFFLERHQTPWITTVNFTPSFPRYLPKGLVHGGGYGMGCRKFQHEGACNRSGVHNHPPRLATFVWTLHTQ